MSRKVLDRFIIKASDGTLEGKVKRAYIYTERYNRSFKPREIHSPRAAKVIIHTDDRIFYFTLMESLIVAQGDGLLRIMSHHSLDKILNNKIYYTKEQIKEFKYLKKAYETKKEFGLTNAEAIEFNLAKSVVAYEKMSKKRIPHERTGGF